MSGPNNATVSTPGPGSHHWSMLWPQNFEEFQLDIVGFLAILGEGSVAANAQVAALTRLFYLPRLIPAPQALLWPTRPSTLPTAPASATAVYSGNVKDYVHHVANVLLRGDSLPKFTVRCVKIEKSEIGRDITWIDTFFRGERKEKAGTKWEFMRKLTSLVKAKFVGPRNQPAGSKRAKKAHEQTNEEEKEETIEKRMPSVKAKATGPLAWVTLLGCVLSVTLFIVSITVGDGMSLLATILLSLLSTVVGIGNKWTLALPQAAKGVSHNDGDVVIRYPKGSYLVVKCSELVSRELFFAPEEIEYNIKSSAAYRLITLIGTLLLMLGVIALANARLPLQVAWAGAYILINIAQWAAAAVPPSNHWDMSCYTLTEIGISTGPENKVFTAALWKAILLTKSIDWVAMGKAAPVTPVWSEWLEEAKKRAITAGSHFGDLADPAYPKRGHGQVFKGTVVDVPNDWNPKDAWNEINERYKNKHRPMGKPEMPRKAPPATPLEMPPGLV